MTPEIQRVARSLVLSEAAERPAGTEAAMRSIVCEKLRPPLATLMGQGGFGALLSRALSIAQAEVPWLGGWQVQRDGTLVRREGMAPPADHAAIIEGETVLVAQVIGLLATFIGEKLTLQMLREVWPNLPSADFKPLVHEK